jgi:hypothetical protein
VSGLGGERGRNRTFNLLIKSQLLCQLSYAPFNNLRRLRGRFCSKFAPSRCPYCAAAVAVSTRSMAAVTSAVEQCGNGQTPLAFCGLKSASQLALEGPSVYEVASRGAPHVVND